MGHRIGIAIAIAISIVLSSVSIAIGQLPDLPGAVGKPIAKADEKANTVDTVSAPTEDNPEATVAATSGPILVDVPVQDDILERTARDLLSQYPGVSRVDVKVENGVVTLEGEVDNDDVRNNVTQFTRRIEGVRLILNRMKTDAQSMSAWQLANKTIGSIGDRIASKWLLVILALSFVFIASLAARLVNSYSETILAPFVKNLLLRSVLGSFLGTLLFVGGCMIALGILELTEVVVSILGLASIVGLAIGFAFRDITENFIASILLGMRRPFRVGDYIHVAGKSGIVRTLNTRATVLVTLEGNHVRIPNSTIFKEILVNSSASTNVRGTFDILIPYEVSTACALESVTKVLSQQEGVLSDPPPRTLVDSLELKGVRLRTYFWFPSQGIDGLKLLSDLKLKAKVELQREGIAPPPTFASISIAGRIPVEVMKSEQSDVVDIPTPARSVVSIEQAEENLRRDEQAAAVATIQPSHGSETPAEHVLNDDDTRVSSEGQNLLAEPETKQSKVTSAI